MNKEDGRDKRRMEKRLRHPRKRLDAAVYHRAVKIGGYHRYGQNIVGSNPGDDPEDLLQGDENEANGANEAYRR